MGRDRRASKLKRTPLLGAILVLLCFVFTPAALAGPPNHVRAPGLDIHGFDHACGVAADSEGDVFVASAGESAIRIFDSTHSEIKAIANLNEPCGLAVDGKGVLYASERNTGDVVKYVPGAYPFAGPPTYSAPVVVDGGGSPGVAGGISVDAHDNRLYVARGDHVAVYKSDGSLETNLGGGVLANATGVAAYTWPGRIIRNFEGKIVAENATRYLFVADAATDEVKILSGEVRNPNPNFFDPNPGPIADPVLRKTVAGVDQDGNPETADQPFGFGPAGAYLAVDPGNRSLDDGCTQIAAQACTSGHLLVYDDAHEAVDEFDASGEFLDQIHAPGELGDAEPSAMAVERSGGSNDGTVYVTAGAGSGAGVLAFAPLVTPERTLLPQPPSQEFPNARAVATDSRGDFYVAGGPFARAYGPGRLSRRPLQARSTQHRRCGSASGRALRFRR